VLPNRYSLSQLREQTYKEVNVTVYCALCSTPIEDGSPCADLPVHKDGELHCIELFHEQCARDNLDALPSGVRFQ
jgi:hypothetical protein